MSECGCGIICCCCDVLQTNEDEEETTRTRIGTREKERSIRRHGRNVDAGGSAFDEKIQNADTIAKTKYVAERIHEFRFVGWRQADASTYAHIGSTLGTSRRRGSA